MTATGACAEQVRRDHQAPPVPAVSDDARDRAEHQLRQVLCGEGEPGVAQ
jgi:hypothetical protein